MLFIILIVLSYFYRRFEDKRIREEDKENYETIRRFLLNDDTTSTLANSKKPILWIHIPYEYNSRNWLSFGSRSSFDLNQPYLYLTVKSIINQCNDSFHICLIDDNSFSKLIPTWNVDMNTISSPITNNVRTLALAKLLHIYGGLICPISFLCMRDLSGLYQKGIQGDKMFICENIDRNITSTSYKFYPDIHFMGSPKENDTLGQFIDFIQRTISRDFTAESQFLGDFDRWCESRVRKNEINLISGIYIGVKNMNDEPIKLEDLLGQNYIDLYPKTYGIFIPANEILNRRYYEWFSRLSAKQVLEADTILSKYMLLSNTPDAKMGVIEPLETRPNWVGFWKVPSDAPVYGLRPINLGDQSVMKIPYPTN
jgi:hypothetical protein